MSKKIKNIDFHKVAASVWSCFPIISPKSKAYVKPFRQFKDLSDKVEIHANTDGEDSRYVYWTTIPAMFLCALSDIFGFKEECLDFLGMGVTKHEGHAEFARYVEHYNLIIDKLKYKHDWEMSDGERAFLRKIKIVRIKLNNISDGKTIFKYD
jgi:hypothetical protein